MASLPYITSVGNIEKALIAIKSAAVPEKITQDFVKTILKIPGGSGDQMTAYLKKLDFASTDGTPTDRYKRFRNPTTSGQSVATAIRHAYSPLYVRNEFMHELPDDELLGLIVEETGQAQDSNPVKLAFACIKALKKHASFEDPEQQIEHPAPASGAHAKDQPPMQHTPPATQAASTQVGLNLGYTVNLNLPATKDQDVFNAIFKSLKEHLLSSDDG